MPRYTFKADDGTKYVFANKGDLAEFVRNEINALGWIGNYNHPYTSATQWNELVAPLQNLQSILTQEAPDPATIDSFFNQYAQSKPQLHQKTAARKWLDPLAAKNPLQAVYAMAYLTQATGRVGTFDAIHGGQSDFHTGVAKAISFLEGYPAVSEKVQANQKLAEDSAQETLEALAKARDAQTNLDELEATVAEAERVRAEARTAADDAISENSATTLTALTNSATETLARVDAEWKNFQREITSQLALKAPSTFWKLKHRRHTLWVGGLSLISLAAGAFGGWLLHELAWEIFGPLRFNQIPSWYQVITFSLGALVYVLVLRSLLRILMSHVHLALDSAERQTMIVSYLALARRGNVQADSLDKILASIFRPTGDGIVKDEGIPLSILSELLKK